MSEAERLTAFSLTPATEPGAPNDAEMSGKVYFKELRTLRH